MKDHTVTFYLRRTEVAALVMTAIASIAVLFSISAMLLLGAPRAHAANSAPSPAEATKVYHRRIKVDGLEIAYREAGDPQNPTVLLLHGFPTSSQMFRNLIPALAEEYHVLAPDYPGYGASAIAGA